MGESDGPFNIFLQFHQRKLILKPLIAYALGKLILHKSVCLYLIVIAAFSMNCKIETEIFISIASLLIVDVMGACENVI